MIAFGVPLALYVLDLLNGNDVSFVEAVAMVTKTPFGPFCYLLLILSMVRPSWRRMRALRLPSWTGLAVPFLLFADLPYLLAARQASLVGESVAGPGGPIPIYISMALCLIVAMVLTPAPAEDERPFTRFGLAGKGAALALAFVVFFLLVLLAMSNVMAYLEPRLEAGDPSLGLFLTMIKNAYWPLRLNPYVCLAFVVLLAWCVVRVRKITRPSPPATS